jgi:hypothetical protein
MSIVLVNEKVSAHATSAWPVLLLDEARLSALFTRVLLLRSEWLGASLAERTAVLSFLVHAFAALEHAPVRRALLCLVSLPLWLTVSNERRELEIARHPSLRRACASRKCGRRCAPHRCIYVLVV